MCSDTENIQPIKRHNALKSLSREHHHGLLLGWKIREGFRKKIEPMRIKKYKDWYWKNYLSLHFEIEEKYVFSVLGNSHALIRKALSEHRRLKRLFESQTEISHSLSLIEEELERHIRFEERILFNEIQQIASSEQLECIEALHSHQFCDDWKDKFWE